MQQPIQIEGGFFVCSPRAAAIAGLPQQTLWRWASAQVTGYGYALKTLEHRGHLLIDERDVYVVAGVQQALPIPKGRLPRAKRDAMKRLADKFHATLHPVG